MIKRAVLGIGVLGAVAVAWLTAPTSVDAPVLTKTDVDNGAYIYHAAGCASCHMAEGGTDRLALVGGQKFETPFGIFIAPNVSMSIEHGIGAWEFGDFYTALKHGQSPTGLHYFPAFPYTTYTKMTDQDIADLWAFWQTLPAIDTPSAPHQVSFPFNQRRAVGLWKQLYLTDEYIVNDGSRGAYLVEALGHCAECHTPRDAIGGLKTSAWMTGAPNPSGKGQIPSIHPNDLTWDEAEIAEYLNSGFTPDYDMAGGKMVSVIDSLRHLTDTDRAAIAGYITGLAR